MEPHDREVMSMSSDEIRQRTRLIENDVRIMRSEIQRVKHESEAQTDRIKENLDKIKLNKQLPYLVGNIVEVLEDLESNHEEDGMALDVDSQRCYLVQLHS